MNNCLLCHRKLFQKIESQWLMSFKPLARVTICTECEKKFETLENKEICEGCGRLEKQSLCQDCLCWQEKGYPSLCNRALFVYQNEAMKDYFQRYKFMGDYYMRNVWQSKFSQYIRKNYPSKNWRYVPIPVSQATMQSRGFNQVEGLIKGLKLDHDLVVWQQTKQVQAHKNRKQRMENQQIFEYVGPQINDHKNVLLIDDVYTTGRTLYFAQELISKYTTKAVKSVTLAR